MRLKSCHGHSECQDHRCGQRSYHNNQLSGAHSQFGNEQLGICRQQHSSSEDTLRLDSTSVHLIAPSYQNSMFVEESALADSFFLLFVIKCG